MDTTADENSVAGRVLRTLRDRITSGALPGGARLVERAIAEEMGVSRLPVREAIRHLVVDGLVDRAPRRGGVVHVLSRADVADIAELHHAFDRLAVRQAAIRRDTDDLTRFHQDVEQARQAAAEGDHAELRRAGLAFRTHTYEAARNTVLLEVHHALLGRTLRMFALSDPAMTAPVHYYARFEEAFRRQAPDTAAAAMADLSEHFGRARHRRVLAELEEGGADRSPPPGNDDGTDTTEDTYTPDFVTIRDELRAQIVSGVRSPGDVLSERPLGQEFGVSRIPVRQAIESLAREGLVSHMPSRVASTVREISSRESEDLFDVASTLDVLATNLAARRPSPEALALLRAKLRAEQEAGLDRPSQTVHHMFAFRRQICRMAGNRLVLDVNQIVESRMRMQVAHAPLARVVLTGHRLLYEAIASRDTRLAELIYREVFTRADRRDEILARDDRPNGPSPTA